MQINLLNPKKEVYQEQKTNICSDMKLKLEEIIQNIISPVEDDFDTQLNKKFLELDFGSVFDVDATKIAPVDALFFLNILNENSAINYKIEDDKLSLDCNKKSIAATNPLLDMLKTSIESKKPIRLDFGSDVTVILKLDKEGKIMAHFIPGSSAVEKYLKENIPSLRQIFEQENINYSHLGYSQSKKKKKEKR